MGAFKDQIQGYENFVKGDYKKSNTANVSQNSGKDNSSKKELTQSTNSNEKK